MGFSIHDFSHLGNMLTGEFGRGAINSTMEAISKALNLPGKDASLFAVIIHNPGKHIEFDNYLKENFFRFHQSSGQKFLFFTIVPPPQKWLDELKNRLSSLFSQNLQLPSIDLSGITAPYNLDRSIGVLSSTFEIFLGDEPIIMLFRSLEDRSVITFKTNSDLLEQQFKILTDASNIPRVVEDIGPIHNFLMRYECFRHSLSRRNYYDSVIQSLKRVALDITSKISNVPVAEEATARNIREEIGQLQESISRIKQNLQTLTESDEFIDETELQKIYKLNRIITEFELTLAGSTFNVHEVPLYVRLSRLFDRESLGFIETALKFERLVSGRITDGREEELDFSGITMGYAKAFELEINLSFNHFLRIKKDVEMPDYFFKYKPDHTAVYRIERNDRRDIYIDVNRKNDYPPVDDQNWLSLELGRSKVIAMHISGFQTGYADVPQEIQEIFGDRLIRFLDIWEEIKLIRNNGAHLSRTPWDQVQIIKEYFYELLDMGIFESLYELKKKYRGY